jgi:hypothetical protein
MSDGAREVLKNLENLLESAESKSRHSWSVRQQLTHSRGSILSLKEPRELLADPDCDEGMTITFQFSAAAFSRTLESVKN